MDPTEKILVADRAADPAWREHADVLIEQTAQRLPELTTDDLWEAGLEETRENRALGQRLRDAASRGILRRTDRFQVARRRSQGNQAVWESLVFIPPGPAEGRHGRRPQGVRDGS